MNVVMRQTLSYVLVALFCTGLWGCAGSQLTSNVASVLPVSEQWRSLTIDNFSVDVPPGFVAGLPGLELEALQGSLEEMGFGDLADWLAQNAENIDVLAFQQVGEQLNSINVVRDGRSPEETVEDYVMWKVQQLKTVGVKAESEILETEPVVGKLQLLELGQAQSIYVFAGTDDFWVVTYSGKDGQFDDSLIEKSRRSVEILSESE